jgi:hypothetical protein
MNPCRGVSIKAVTGKASCALSSFDVERCFHCHSVRAGDPASPHLSNYP